MFDLIQLLLWPARRLNKKITRKMNYDSDLDLNCSPILTLIEIVIISQYSVF